MTPDEVKDYFGSTYKFYKKTGMSKSTLSKWIKKGFVPALSQYKLQAITNGDLKFGMDDKG